MIQVVVLNMALTTAGLNLHERCANGVMMPLPWNFSNCDQTYGHLYRPNAPRFVEWNCDVTLDTFMPWQQ